MVPGNLEYPSVPGSGGHSDPYLLWDQNTYLVQPNKAHPPHNTQVTLNPHTSNGEAECNLLKFCDFLPD